MLRSFKLILIFFILSVCTFFYACPQPGQVPTRTESLSDQDLEAGKATLTYEEALVVFVSGEVYVKGTADWEYLEIGNIVHPGETVKVGADSLCELQFGQKSVIRVQEDTEISLKELWLEPEQAVVDVDLAVGSVLCKVSTLSGNESFKVRTRTAVCGIRGTEFMVRITDSKDTLLAVKEGAVSIVPESAESDKIQEQAQLGNTKLKALVEKMQDMALVVKAHQEVTINEENAKQTEQLVKVMVDEVKKADQDEELTEEQLAIITTLVTETNEKINQVITPPQEVSTEKEEELKDLDQIEIKEVRIIAEKTGDEKDKIQLTKTVPVLIKIKITTEPKDADIYLNGLSVGKGRFQKLYEEGKALEFTVKKSGFAEQNITVETNIATQKDYSVVLQELSPEQKAQAEKKAKDEVKAKDALNKAVGLIDKPEEKKPVGIIKEVVPIKKIKVADSGFIGELLAAGELNVAASKQGVIYAFDTKGGLVWSQKTANSPNHNSWPKVIGGNLYFAGSRELVIMDTVSGKVRNRRALTTAENQMFGRSIVAAGNSGLFATDSAIQFVDLRNGNIQKELNIPGGSLMTPALYKGKIYIVNLMGELISMDAQSGVVDPQPLKTKAIGPIALPVTVFQGRAYFCGRKGMLVCVDLNNKRILWQKKLDPNSNIYPHQEITALEQAVYIYAGDKIFAFASNNGRLLFRPPAQVTAPPLYLNGRLYYSRNDGSLVIADAMTGNVQRLIKIDNRINCRPLIRGKLLILATDQGEILLVSKVIR
ncbi:MAG: PQQ-binding-like beta-propeller repeat protein [Spirochaetales bacterium]|nr:PQQ-binding-like beta-propeller repeat protein [Spirochaetales bacterium]